MCVLAGVNEGRRKMKDVCRFTFSQEIEREVIETHLALAIVVAECMYGQARVRLNAAYLISNDGKQAAIDVSNEVGEHIARLFTGLIIRELGEEGFVVERLPKQMKATRNQTAAQG